ncbi:MAG: hypothetical protein AB7P37_22385 [Ramlibacter sp.]
MKSSSFFVYLLGAGLVMLVWYSINLLLRRRQERLSLDDAEKVFVLLIAIALVGVAFFVG